MFAFLITVKQGCCRLATFMREGYPALVILPDVKRLVRLEELQGRTIEEVKEGFESIRLIFTDGRFVDIDTEGSKIVLRPFQGRKRRSNR